MARPWGGVGHEFVWAAWEKEQPDPLRVRLSVYLNVFCL
jgi:hypothetical protein